MSDLDEARAAVAEKLEHPYAKYDSTGLTIEVRHLRALLAATEPTSPAAEGWEYGVVIDDGESTAVWDEYPGDEARANIEEGEGVRMVRRRPAGPWGNF